MKKNLITVLKKLLAAFGGEDTNSNNAVEVIDKIADSVEQSGSGSGGSGVMQVIATSGTSDKTFGELLTAYDAGTTIIVSYVSSNGFTCKGTVIGTSGVYVDSKGKYNGNVVVAKGIKEDNNLTTFSMWVGPTVSEADALAAYPNLS